MGVAVLLAVGFVVSLSRAGEPRYKGRTLSSWLKQCADTPLDQEKELKEAQAAGGAAGAAAGFAAASFARRSSSSRN